MPLFVDPRARERLAFPAVFVNADGTEDAVTPELIGEWIEVRQSIGSGEWREIQAGAMTLGPGRSGDGGPDWEGAFQGANGLRRLAAWIEDTSFTDHAGRKYPPQNMTDRMRWLGAMWPPAGADVDRLLSEYIDRAWRKSQATADPRPGESSAPDPTTRQNLATLESANSGTS